MPEERLAGGNMNAVWKSGESVYRSAGPWTPTIQRLLRHVRDRGVDFAPEPRGVDDQGREILAFLPGVVPAYPLEDWVWAETLLVDAAKSLRAFHDATLDFPIAGAVWRMPAHGQIEVICHNDFAPYNFVCVEGRLTGVIDFDISSPGSRIWDLAYLAYRLCPLAAPTNPDAMRAGRPFPPRDQERRLELILRSYGATFTARQTIETAIDRLIDLAEFSERRALEHDQPELAAHAILYRTDAADLRGRLDQRTRPLE